jgi:hypothetical protein
MTVHAPAGTAVQMSGRDEAGRWILSVLAKRTYALGANGEVALHDVQRPLLSEPRYDDATLVLEEDMDTWPYKPLTDVVVLGHAYNHRARPTFSAGVSIGGTAKLVAVCGDRACAMGPDGRVIFSEPTVSERVPLSYARAYGGRDTAAEAAHGNPVELLRPFLPPETDPAVVSAASPFVYPRNPAGRGYLVEQTPAAVEALALPNLEHPDDLLSPERLAAGETGRWLVQPVPASLGWLDYGAFPRAAWFGMVADHEPDIDPRHIGELRLGYCRTDALVEKDPPDPLTLAGVNGASLGLRVPHLRGGEVIELLNLSPERETVRLRLPVERPVLRVDGRASNLLPTDPVIHSIVVEPDKGLLSIVWRGCAAARRPYRDDELQTMPFGAVWDR